MDVEMETGARANPAPIEVRRTEYERPRHFRQAARVISMGSRLEHPGIGTLLAHRAGPRIFATGPACDRPEDMAERPPENVARLARRKEDRILRQENEAQPEKVESHARFIIAVAGTGSAWL